MKNLFLVKKVIYFDDGLLQNSGVFFYSRRGVKVYSKLLSGYDGWNGVSENILFFLKIPLSLEEQNKMKMAFNVIKRPK